MSHTHTINIFLASSNELINDRNSFQAFIASLDDIYENRGWRIKCRRWEDFPAYCTGNRTQDAYNNIVRASDMCIALFHMQAGQYTIEEFNQAMDGYRECGHPKTYVYARVVIDGEMESEVLKAFKQQLNEVMGHYWCSYATDDAMKLHFVMQFERLMNPEEGISAHQESALQVKEGVVRLHGREVARYENLAFASENEEYKRLKGEIASLEKDIVMLRSLQNEALQPMIIEKLTQQNQARELLGKLEDNLFDTALYISKMLGSDTPITPRERLAIEFFEKGNNKGVIDTLRMEDIAADAEDAAQRREKLRQMRESIDAADKQIIEEIRSIIEEYGLRAKALMQEYSNPNHFTEACQAYEAAITLAEKHLNHNEIAEQYFDYASFLDNHNQFDKAIDYCLQAVEIFEKLALEDPHTYNIYIADTQNNLALLYDKTNRLHEAEELFLQASVIYSKLVEENNEKYLPKFVMLQLNLGTLLYSLNRMKEAENLFDRALELLNRYSEEDREIHLEHIAIAKNNLANLYDDTNRTEDAERVYKEALDVYEAIAARNPEKVLPLITLTQNNLAGVCYKLDKIEEAIDLWECCLDKFDQLAEKNPEAHLPNVATVLYNLASIYNDIEYYKGAEEYFLKTLSIRTELAVQHPEAYLPEVANVQHNLATLYSMTNREQEAEELYNKALETRRKLAAQLPEVYRSEVALTLYNLAILYKDTHCIDEALTAIDESLMLYTTLNETTEEDMTENINDAEYLKALIEEMRQ